MEELKCSFCQRPESECQQIVVAESEAAICNKCVTQCFEIMMGHLEKTKIQELAKNAD